MGRIHEVSRREPSGGLSSAFLWLAAIGIASWMAIALVVESAIRLAS